MGNSEPKILYTTADASPQSGAFRSLLYMSRGITEYGYEPILAVDRAAQDLSLLTTDDHRRANFFDLPRPRRRQSVAYYLRLVRENISGVRGLAGLIRRGGVDLVHVNEILDVYGGLAAWMAGVPCVWHVRADLAMVPRVRWVLSRLVLPLATRVVVVSDSVRARMFDGRGEDKVVVIHNPGPDLTEFHPGTDGSAIRDEFAFPDDAFVVTLIAKLAERKGQRTLVRAAPEVLASFPDTYFMIVGGEIDTVHHQRFASELRMLPAELDIGDRVIFTGFRTDVPEIMAASDVVMHCSHHCDPFPGVVLQGMASGKPVIASNRGGPLEQIEHGVSGLLVEPAAPSALADAICSLLADEDRRRALGEAAARCVRRQFGPEAFFETLDRLYGRVLKE